MYRTVLTFRSWSESANRYLELLLFGTFAPWPFRSQVLSLPATQVLRRVSHVHFYENLVAANLGKRRGVVVECRIRDREVAGSSLGRALRRKNSGQVSHTYG